MDWTGVARPGEDLSGRTGVSRESRLERREGALGVGPVLVRGRNLGVRGEGGAPLVEERDEREVVSGEAREEREEEREAAGEMLLLFDGIHMLVIPTGPG